MSIGSVDGSNGVVAAPLVRKPEPTEANSQATPDESNNNITINNNNTNINTNNSMSTEDFLSLRESASGNSAEDMMETVKDVMALKMLEKTLEVINKMMED